MRKALCLLLPLVALPLLAAEDEPGWFKDVAAARRLARQHNRPMFAVLH